MYKILIISFILFLNLYSQSSNTLFDLYTNKHYSLLKEKLETSTQIQDTERSFFEAVFLKDGESAFQIYESLFRKTEGKLKYYTAERLKDYYYARGYYSTASDYEKFLVEHKALVEQETEVVMPDIVNQSPVDTDLLYIQVGAFGISDNAGQMKEMLRTQNIESKIVLREINGQRLYCVWIAGKINFEETLKFANDIKQKYHLNFKIIKE